jgi:hypothetical protein
MEQSLWAARAEADRLRTLHAAHAEPPAAPPAEPPAAAPAEPASQATHAALAGSADGRVALTGVCLSATHPSYFFLFAGDGGNTRGVFSDSASCDPNKPVSDKRALALASKYFMARDSIDVSGVWTRRADAFAPVKLHSMLTMSGILQMVKGDGIWAEVLQHGSPDDRSDHHPQKRLVVQICSFNRANYDDPEVAAIVTDNKKVWSVRASAAREELGRLCALDCEVASFYSSADGTRMQLKDLLSRTDRFFQANRFFQAMTEMQRVCIEQGSTNITG